MPGFEIIPFNDLAALEAKLKADPYIVAFNIEPIQVCTEIFWKSILVVRYVLCVLRRMTGALPSAAECNTLCVDHTHYNTHNHRVRRVS